MHPRDLQACFPIITQPAAPGAGNTYGFTIADYHRRMLISATFEVSTSVTAANRIFRISHYPTAGSPNVIGSSGFLHIASQTKDYHAAIGFQHAEIASGGGLQSIVLFPLAKLDWFYIGDQLVIEAQNFAGGDTISNIFLRWLIQPAPAI